ncbi:methyltransferase domain-containing protein [Streptomyces sp. NPDC012461]|uniref:methyltransferase domain-containing protein n=2 Tax=Streptomyces TaxID=1883 RepID=UPI001961DB74|nr:methyltransferase domain-containing protein [Streptomyces sp. S12]
MMRSDGNLLDHRPDEAAERLDAFAALFDATTFRHLEAIGTGPGWRCWEVGAAGPSVLAWLGRRVGPTGRVLATATDPARLSAAARPPVEVRAHDIGTEEPPAEGGFDLVHARLPFVGAAEPERVIRFMVRVLRPGGRLLVEDTDPALQPLLCPDEHGPEQQLANRLRNGLRRLLADRGTDLAQGRRLPRLLREAGLSGVRADAYFPLAAPECAALESATMRLVRDRLVGAGIATAQDVDRHLTNVAAGALDLSTAPLVAAWGRKP